MSDENARDKKFIEESKKRINKYAERAA